MATVYVRSTDGNDADDGSTWALADATMAASLTAAGAGGTCYVSGNHAESDNGTKTLASSGTAASPTRVLSVNDAGNPEPPTALLAGASVTVASSSPTITFTGYAYYHGITFVAGTGAATATLNVLVSASGLIVFDTCALQHAATGPSSVMNIGPNTTAAPAARVELLNTTVQFGATGQSIVLGGGTILWRGGSITGSTFPTSLFTCNTNRLISATIRDVDLSALGSGKNLINVSSGGGSVRFIDCKLGASVGFATGTYVGQGGIVVEIINCDSGDTNYNYYKGCYEGEVFDETTIVRTGGASDGTTPLAHRYVSSANTKFYAPLVGPWRGFWNETTGSAVTVAMECVWFGTALLKDDEAWIEVEYLGTSGFPISSFASDRAADILTAGANQTASTEPWVGTDRANSNLYSLNDIIEVQGRLWICTTAGSSDSSEPAGYASGSDGSSVNDGGAVFRAGYRLTLSKQVTPQEKGLIRARVCLAKVSTTLYACPKLEVS